MDPTSPMPSDSTPCRPSFLTLPAEIRQEIYEHVFTDIVVAEFNNFPETYLDQPNTNPFALLRTCKQIKAEVEPIADRSFITMMANENEKCRSQRTQFQSQSLSLSQDVVSISTRFLEPPPRIRRQIWAIELLMTDPDVNAALKYYPRENFPNLEVIDLVKAYECLIGTYAYEGQEYEYQVGLREDYLRELVDSGVTETDFDLDLHSEFFFGFGSDEAVEKTLQESPGLSVRFWCGLQALSMVQRGGGWSSRQSEWAYTSCLLIWNDQGMKLMEVRKVEPLFVGEDGVRVPQPQTESVVPVSSEPSPWQ
ncbi:hypothetical protein A1O1_02450 [Capronia coronata CBS 617.96]|uniref:F-box domain-containing protein n=1 Tax=Capronia coronata CBS 617.96 TaxID=1182541 RepID=W9YMA8_9EURO|nr:uncharacterized protein A1O1_02450 [Capronia coronata CBS 617.96]EXJ94057.1 hypothetical protein A1O1_02450 [Capronia coronata CBS 617.96]